MKYVSCLVFACSLTLLLLANSTTYAVGGYLCKGLPFVYEVSHTGIEIAPSPPPPTVIPRSAALAIDLVAAAAISALIGLFAWRFSRIQRGPRVIFLLAVLAFAAANVHLIHYGSPTPDAISDFNRRHFFAPYRYYVMLVPSVALTVSGLVWLLVSARRRRPQPSSVTQ